MIRALTAVTVILGIVSTIALIVMFGALHDISVDYASAETWTREGKTVPDWVPEWTACELEWNAIEVGWWLLAAFHVAFFAFLIVRHRAGRRLEGLE